MDGNGRWARRRDLARSEGHAAGEIALTAAVDAALEEGIEWFTLFAFSTENWHRPDSEVDFLMAFNQRLIEKYGDAYHSRGVRVRYLGRPDTRVPASVQQTMNQIQARTRSNSRLTLTFAFNYGGRAELVDVFRSLLVAGVTADDVDERLVAKHLQFPDMPDPDLIIRTSGEYRLSNFMLWGAAYAELVFLNVLWPDFRARHLRHALRIYQTRQRRFGALRDPRVPGSSASSG